MKEQALLIGQTHPLAAVVSLPRAIDTGRPAVIVLNAGIVHHVGPGRWSVRLARRLAQLGHVAVRFDHGGIGDSDPRRDSVPFEAGSVIEVREIIDHVQRAHGTSRFVLLGLCSGASTSFLTAAEGDPRVAAIVLVNPPAGGATERSVEVKANDLHAGRYWSISLFDPSAWWRALTGRIEYRRLFRVLVSHVKHRIKPVEEAIAESQQVATQLAAVCGRGVRVLVLFSARDEGKIAVDQILARPELRAAFDAGAIRKTVIAGSDHTFALHCNQERLIAEVEGFVTEAFATPASSPSPAAAVAAPHKAAVTASAAHITAS
jgi:pimeloyl-ACP methyl ester carboxylesterase